MKFCRSELPAIDVLHRYNALRPYLLLPRFPILRLCDAFVTNFTAADFRALYSTVDVKVAGHRRLQLAQDRTASKSKEESTTATVEQRTSNGRNERTNNFYWRVVNYNRSGYK
ncbi:hypothetical protein EVAR_13323_1 [Eumeta japonica]|uniref:Uncharacterized protein n=1 Tax=Eumeta variegata TaxID=151549 RepID=A0A4C1TRU5_EUMVA|nr:hypothetical protein EVAR_13323_1 [Eumeta japonica]